MFSKGCAWTLIRSAGAVLLDAAPDPALSQRIVQRLESKGDRLADLHVWRVGPGHLAAVVSVVSDTPQQPSYYKRQIAGMHGLSHVTVEVIACPGAHPHEHALS